MKNINSEYLFKLTRMERFALIITSKIGTLDDGYPFTNLKPTYEKGEK